jgi:hypothetical protein
MGVTAIGLCLNSLWFFSNFNTNMATGEPSIAPPSVWQRVARSMRLTPAQVRRAALSLVASGPRTRARALP